MKTDSSSVSVPSSTFPCYNLAGLIQFAQEEITPAVAFHDSTSIYGSTRKGGFRILPKAAALKFDERFLVLGPDEVGYETRYTFARGGRLICLQGRGLGWIKASLSPKEPPSPKDGTEAFVLEALDEIFIPNNALVAVWNGFDEQTILMLIAMKNSISRWNDVQRVVLEQP